MTRIAMLLGVALVLLGGSSALAASGADTFRMPSGNVYCAYEHYDFAPFELRCEIRSKVRPLPLRPASCRDADWGDGYSMGQRGLAHVLCISDTIYDPKARVLRYGETRAFGVFTCWSTTTGLRCTNASGNGFFLSREHSYAFTKRTAPTGNFKTPSGNIVCGWAPGRVDCVIKSGLKPRPPLVHCDGGDPTDKRVSLTATGRAVPETCAGDPGPLLAESKAIVLGYGQTWSGGGITCTSATTGLTCKNRASHGFFLSRERWRSF